MSEMIEMLGRIAENVGGEWEQAVLINNDTDNDLVDAYNQGVRAMASQVCYYLNAIISGKRQDLVLQGMRGEQ
jgi:hypothetical protein